MSLSAPLTIRASCLRPEGLLTHMTRLASAASIGADKLAQMSDASPNPRRPTSSVPGYAHRMTESIEP
jgi:hypothetical protein